LASVSYFPRRLRVSQRGNDLKELLVILVVEDDQLIQGMVEEALTEGGYELAIATSGEEAVTLLKGNKANYRALVTDINLLSKLVTTTTARAVIGRSQYAAMPTLCRSNR
jgi:CheY-like chemotaxis protein